MLIVDSHLDLAMNALLWNRDLTQTALAIRDSEAGMVEKGRALGTVSFPELRRGKVFLNFCTVLARTNPRSRNQLDFRTHDIAYACAQGQLAYYRILEQQAQVRMITDGAQLAEHLAQWQQDDTDKAPLGLVLTMEGADPIVSPDQVEAWYNQGLRGLSLAHYGESKYGYGTDTDGGVKPPGRELLREMERLGIMLDLTHTADRAFWEEVELFSGRVYASHHNCRALVPGQRQFTDEMIKALIQRDGVIGVAFDNWMLYPGWVRGETANLHVGLEDVVNHIDHICQLAGNAEHVAIGTDLDGGYGYEQSPYDLHTIADLQKIPAILTLRGYTREQIQGIMHGNWVRFLQQSWER